MKNSIVILILGIGLIMLALLSWVNFQLSSYANPDKNQIQYTTNELESKLYTPQKVLNQIKL